MLIVEVLRPLVVALGLHGGHIRGGLIACWSGGAMLRALSRELVVDGRAARLSVTVEGPRMVMPRGDRSRAARA